MHTGCMAEWMYDLRPVFEVHRGRGWELMDLCFMTCFTGTLPSSVTPAHLWFTPRILILFTQSWQPCIIHPSPPVLLLCLSWFSFLLSLSTSFFIFLCRCLLFFLSSSLSPLLLHLTTLLRSSGLRRRSPCAPWRCGSCLNGTALIFACMPSPPRSTMLGRNCALSSVLLIKRTVSILFFFLRIMGFEHLLRGPLQPLRVCVRVI